MTVPPARKTQILDISLEISEKMLVYPGNTPPRINFTRKMPNGNSNLSEILIGSHTGTHVDSLLHVKNGAGAVTDLPYDSLVGPSRVIDLSDVETGITSRDLSPHKVRRGEIILLKTRNSQRGYKEFYEDFVFMTEDGAEHLVHQGVKTIGHDYIAIQKFRSGNVDVHKMLLEAGLTVFEGLNLTEVRPGRYYFIGLPLKVRTEASPARAFLLK
ncbi:MAG: cyclase family protein [Thaumarchaeota archaeon]|nr:cyclase family protein [Nitrososphaerota archaeon]